MPHHKKTIWVLPANKLQIAIKINKAKPVNMGVQHYQFETLIKILSTKLKLFSVTSFTFKTKP